jgi:transposase
VPPPEIRRLRDVTRYRADLVEARTAEKQRAEKMLEDACIKLSVVATDIFGVSGRAMMAALIAGERNPKVLAQLARARMRAKITALEEAFTGHFTDHHAFLLGKMLTRVDQIDADIAELDAKISELIAPYWSAVQRLDEIHGIGPVAAAAVIAEIGVDMSRFPTAGHLASWAKFAPGVKQSAGKNKGAAPPGTATPTSRGSWATLPWGRPGPIPSSASATGGSPAAAARAKPSSPSAGPSWSSSGTCSLTPGPATQTSAPASEVPGSATAARCATTSASSKPSATKSPSNPPADPQDFTPAPLRSAGVLPPAR